VGQIALFLILLFALTWPWGVLVVPAAMPHGQLAFLAAFLPMVWAPTVIALGILWYREGPDIVKRELRARLTYRQGSGRWHVLAGGTPIVITAVALASAWAVGDGAPFIPSNAVLLTLGVQVITGASGEELGWRGYLLPRLGERIGALSAALVMSTLWAFWHLPAFFTPGMPHQLIPMLSFLLVVAGFGLFLALLFNEGGESVLPTMLAHLALNATLAVGGVNLASGVFWRTMAAIYGALAVGAIVRLRTQGVRQPVSA
jgi:membrane protease YdiL (CAAX protease family)